MSQETIAALNTQTLIGFTAKRGNAWHYRAEEQGTESNHYVDEVPLEDVRRRLFGWDAVEGSLVATALVVDEQGIPSGTLTNGAPEHKAIMRSDTGLVLGIHSTKYQIHDYKEWLLHNIANILDADLKIGSAGLLKEGRQAWVQIEMPETMEAAEGVLFRPFLTGATSHDGSLATTYISGAQVVVCDNTLSCALGSADSTVKVRHSSRSLGRINDVREGLGLVEQTADAFMAQVKELTSRTVSEDTWKEFVAALTYPGPNPTQRSKNMAQSKVQDIVRLWNYDERVAPWKGSAYGVVAAVNTWEHHAKTVRGASRGERNMSRMVTGAFDKLDLSTLDLLAKVG